MRGNIWIELARDAVVNLKAQRRRTFLALLGVMIGSASIVALMSFSHIARNEVMGRFQTIGVDTVQLSVDLASKQWLALDRVEQTLANDPAVTTAAAMAVTNTNIRMGRHSVSGMVTAVTPQAMQVLDLSAAQGRNLSAVDGCNSAVVLGHKLASDATARVGDVAFIGGYGFNVVGILPHYPTQSLNPVETDEAAFIGMPCATRVMPHDGVSHVLVRLNPDVDSAQWANAAKMRLAMRGSPLMAKTPADLIAAMNSQMNLMSAILVAIGSVSLLVGGVGVMNVMLMSVMERKREIGLRAAIGATPTEIVFLFVVEAVALSLGGGLMGAMCGVGLTAVGCALLPFSFSFDPMVVVWGTGIAGAVGLIFGIHPAISASRILPVEALRAD